MHPASLMNQAMRLLAEAGCPSPRADARLLLAYITGDDTIAAATRREVTAEHAERFTELVKARARGIPVQHLTGEAYFRRLKLAVGPGVFVPRPETEMVAGKAIELLLAYPAPLVVELCAGSGAISAAILDELPTAKVIAVEKSVAAAEYLHRNLASARAQIVVQDIAQPVEAGKPVDLVVANPPYIPLNQREVLPVEVRDHDPGLALFGGDDGLEFFPLVAQAAARLLAPGGWLVVEHGDDQSAAVQTILADHGFAELVAGRDLTGRDRFVFGRRMRE